MLQVAPPRLAAAADHDEAIALLRIMLLAREIDALEARLVARGQAFFHVSGAGHEAVAAMAAFLDPDDWVHAHYRDKALMLARGMPVRTFFDNLLCSDVSPSRGRQMSAHFSWRPGHVLSLCGPVGNNALQAVGVAAEIREGETRPIVLCCLGDGTTQQGEVLEAIGEAVRAALPVVFLIENNALAISTETRGKTFFSLPSFEASEFMGLTLHSVDGSDPSACQRLFRDVVERSRQTRGPAIILMDAERLSDHTHADDQRVYRPADEIATLPSRDPILRLRRSLLEAGVPEQRLDQLADEAAREAKAAAAAAQAGFVAPHAAPGAKAALPAPAPHRASEPEPLGTSLSMSAAINETLRRRMRVDDRVTLFGQDIEDPKGDVFGVTRGLSTAFGRRVENAPLSEATIVGKAVGRALAGGRPVAFLQFADFLPLAFNQITSELASMHWRTAGEWSCPVIVMAPCGGYRQGLGPFHAQSAEAIACHTPGLDVLYPSTARDACGLLDAAFESGRPTLFFYPKALLNDARVALEAGEAWPRVAIGTAAVRRVGKDITLVAYGNCVPLCEAAADWLKTIGITAEILDLRSLSPLDEPRILQSAGKTGRLLVVHEDVGTCGLAAEIMALVAQRLHGVRMARVVRSDTFVPCDFPSQLAVLPSARGILDQAAVLLDLDLQWTAPAQGDTGGVQFVCAAGSPSDESVQMISCHVAVGDRVREGDLLATFETVKAAMEFEAPADGTVSAILANPGSTVKVGEPFLAIARDGLDGADGGAATAGLEPTLRFRPAQAGNSVLGQPGRRAVAEVGILSIAAQLGSEIVRNADGAARHAGRSVDDVERLTGIAVRRRAAPGETAVTLGAAAARAALEQAGLTISDVDAVICATGTPGLATPSLACRILHALAGRLVECQAHDVSAACSGYLYGLQNAFDLLQATTGGCVLLITSEVLTPLVDDSDFETGMLFSDGASATVLATGEACRNARLTLSRPILSASGEPGRYLSVPASRAEGVIAMDGGKVFASAVRSMADLLLQACAAQACTVGDLDLVVPHQANARILHAVAGRLGIDPERVASNIRERGNTSSSTIPICLAERLTDLRAGGKIGLTAFGGGFTAGAALLDVR